jgi:Zn-dependent M28 family amino/carboxypeptidase
MDGAGARRSRTKRRVLRFAIWVVALAVLAVALTRLPAIDPEYLIRGEGRPLFAGALLTLIGSAALLALARVRYVNRH